MFAFLRLPGKTFNAGRRILNFMKDGSTEGERKVLGGEILVNGFRKRQRRFTESSPETQLFFMTRET